MKYLQLRNFREVDFIIILKQQPERSPRILIGERFTIWHLTSCYFHLIHSGNSFSKLSNYTDFDKI